MAGHGPEWCGSDRQAWSGSAWNGQERLGKAGHAWIGKARTGPAGVAWLGRVRNRWARRGTAGVEGTGAAQIGPSRQASAISHPTMGGRFLIVDLLAVAVGTIHA